MSLPVLILGQSGRGKSTSLRNFKHDEIMYVNVSNKPLPFKGGFDETYKTDDYEKITRAMKATDKKIIVIDDAQYLMANEFMNKAFVGGWDKFTVLAHNFWKLVQDSYALPDGKIVYLLAHVEENSEGGEKMKTIGKLLDEKITVEGMFTVVLKAMMNRDGYFFQTQNNGKDTTKSPMGMFPDKLIDNDLKYVDSQIREYYDLETLNISDVNTPKDDEVPFSGGEEPKPRSRTRKPTETLSQKLDITEGVNDPQIVDGEELQTPEENKPEMVEAQARKRRKQRDTEPTEESATNINSSEPEDATEATETPVRRRRRRVE